MATIFDEHNLTDESIQAGLNIDFDKELGFYLSFLRDRWEFTQEENAITAVTKAFNYGRYISRNLGVDGCSEMMSLIHAYEDAHDMCAYREEGRDEFLTLLKNLDRSFRPAYSESLKPFRQTEMPGEKLLVVLRAKPESDFSAQPKNFEDYSRRYHADELTEEEAVYDYSIHVKKYQGLLTSGNEAIMILWSLDTQHAAYSKFEQARYPEEELMTSAMLLGSELQKVYNLSHYYPMLKSIDPTKKQSVQELYDRSSNVLRNYFCYCLHVGNGRYPVKFQKNAFYNHPFDNSDQIPDRDYINEIEKSLKGFERLNEQRQWPAEFELDFRSDGKTYL